MSLPVAIDPDLAAALHCEVRELIGDLDATATSEVYGIVAGLRSALAVVLRAARELDAAILPAADAPLPQDADLPWVGRDANVVDAGSPLAMDLPSAKALVALLVGHAQNLKHLLVEIQRHFPDRREPRDLSLRFAFVMGYLDSELCRPLRRMHPELAPLSLGKAS